MSLCVKLSTYFKLQNSPTKLKTCVFLSNCQPKIKSEFIAMCKLFEGGVLALSVCRETIWKIKLKYNLKNQKKIKNSLKKLKKQSRNFKKQFEKLKNSLKN